MKPSYLVSSVEKLMEGSIELMCCRNSSFCDCCFMAKVSSTYLLDNIGLCAQRTSYINTSQTGKKCHIVVAYSQGLCESYKTICHKYGVQVHFKGGNTLKNLLMFPEESKTKTKQSNMYWFKCGGTECDDEYIGESARTFEVRCSKSTITNF